MSTSTNILRGRRGGRGDRGQRGFTLVEILIVVIILGILAAIVIPQFSSATTDARKGNLQTQLQTLRQAIAYYELQHNNTPPLLISTGWNVLTEYTDASGNPSATSDATHVYGPYLPLNAQPVNPLNGLSSVAATDASVVGWIYNEAGGNFAAGGSTQDGAGYYFNEANNADAQGMPW
jgi:general secretion pathway protein G